MRALRRRYGRAVDRSDELQRAALREFPGSASAVPGVSNADLRKVIRDTYADWQRNWSKDEPDAARFLVTMINDRIYGLDQVRLARVASVVAQ